MAAVAVVGACNDFLDREPLSQISPEAYYNTEAQLNAAVLRLYQSGVSGINYWADNNTDDMAGRTGAASKYTGNLYKTALGDGNWTFDDIYHINYCLEQVLPKYREGKISGADANIRHYIGEMYFLRAMQYFSKYSIAYLTKSQVISVKPKATATPKPTAATGKNDKNGGSSNAKSKLNEDVEIRKNPDGTYTYVKKAKDNSVPETGDGSLPIVWIWALMLGTGVAMLSFLFSKRMRRDDE